MGRPWYNLIAGESLERLAALSDGIFAVAMTLLVLDIHAPSIEKIHSEQELWRALSALGPRLLMWVMSFTTLGIFWTGQQTQLNHLEKSDRNFGWIHLTFLIFVTVMPFSTNLLAEFIEYRLALVVYWANILFLGATLYISWRYAINAGLVREESHEVSCAIERRILIAQSLYAFGALLCLINTYWSIGFIVLVQLNYVIAPRFRPLSRL
jgi:uncharacterized membrane protein